MDRGKGEVIMKTYSVLIIIEEDKIDVLYECDNKKNIRCKGNNNCRECKYTSQLRYAKDITNDKTRLELKDELIKKEKEIEEYKETIKRMMNGENIFNFKTINEIRKIYNLKPINKITDLEKR